MVADTVITAHGNKAHRDVILHPGGVCVMPILENGDILLIRQFRYPTGEFLLEFPAGKLDVEGEVPRGAIERELWEETGYESSDWIELDYIYTAPGFCDERIYCYIAKGCTLAEKKPGQVDDEDIALMIVSPAELRELVKTHQIKDAKTLALIAVANATLSQ